MTWAFDANGAIGKSLDDLPIFIDPIHAAQAYSAAGKGTLAANWYQLDEEVLNALGIYRVRYDGAPAHAWQAMVGETRSLQGKTVVITRVYQDGLVKLPRVLEKLTHQLEQDAGVARSRFLNTNPGKADEYAHKLAEANAIATDASLVEEDYPLLASMVRAGQAPDILAAGVLVRRKSKETALMLAKIADVVTETKAKMAAATTGKDLHDAYTEAPWPTES